MRVSILPLLAAAFASGCGVAPLQAPRDAGTAVLTVRNLGAQPLATTVCGPLACSPARTLGAGAASRFVVQPGNGTRAVVTAKRGDRVVVQRAVDFAPGDEIEVELTVP